MTQPIILVDAFTARPFKGNPAGVCVLAGERPAAWMQDVAAEMNQAETAFLLPLGEDWSLRWFTPVAEVDLCGHATLASAHHLWESGIAGTEVLRFHTRSGVLRAERDGDRIRLDFPLQAPAAKAAPRALIDALGNTEIVWSGRNAADYFVELRSAQAVRALVPDLMRMRALGTWGVIVTARADDGEHDFVSRYFAPAFGIDEDPVTGSTHTALAPYWAERLGRDELLGYQASRRGGTVGVRVRGDRVELLGQAVTTLRGELTERAASS